MASLRITSPIITAPHSIKSAARFINKILNNTSLNQTINIMAALPKPFKLSHFQRHHHAYVAVGTGLGLCIQGYLAYKAHDNTAITPVNTKLDALDTNVSSIEKKLDRKVEGDDIKRFWDITARSTFLRAAPRSWAPTSIT